jgi:Fe-S cluster biosynthesis and repair protein YggX
MENTDLCEGVGVPRPSYVNKRGKTIPLQVSRHAYLQFRERCRLLANDKLDESLAGMVRYFSHSNRVVNLKSYENCRMRRYGNGSDTLYFRTKSFTFVVHDGVIVTVEISDRGKRHLNKPVPAGEAGGVAL